jgi:hypothetical protein
MLTSGTRLGPYEIRSFFLAPNSQCWAPDQRMRRPSCRQSLLLCRARNCFPAAKTSERMLRSVFFSMASRIHGFPRFAQSPAISEDSPLRTVVIPGYEGTRGIRGRIVSMDGARPRSFPCASMIWIGTETGYRLYAPGPAFRSRSPAHADCACPCYITCRPPPSPNTGRGEV